jgi:DNA-binding CsgD family transcriptional regulator
LDLAALAGISQEGVFDDLPFDALSVRKLSRISWDDFCVASERLEARCGCPEECQRLLAEGYDQVLPEFRTLVGGLLSPLNFARMVIEGVSPLVYQGCAFSLHSLGNDRIRVELRLRAGARPSLTFFRATVGELRALPRHLGLPAAEVSADFSAVHGRYDVTLPPSQSVADRALGRARDAVRIVLGMAPDGEPITLCFGGPADYGVVKDLSQRLELATRTWQLTAKQRDVLGAVVEGASNKEIAAGMGCAENTVELHVTQLLRRARVSSRTRLLALFWSKL